MSYPLFLISLGWGKGSKKTVATIETACGLSNGVCISEMRTLNVNPHLSPTKSLLYPANPSKEDKAPCPAQSGPFGGLIVSCISTRPLFASDLALVVNWRFTCMRLGSGMYRVRRLAQRESEESDLSAIFSIVFFLVD